VLLLDLLFETRFGRDVVATTGACPCPHGCGAGGAGGGAGAGHCSGNRIRLAGRFEPLGTPQRGDVVLCGVGVGVGVGAEVVAITVVVGASYVMNID